MKTPPGRTLFALAPLPALVTPAAAARALRRQDVPRKASRLVTIRYDGPGARFSLLLKGVTVRAALHEMARRGGARFRVYRETAGGTEKTFTVSH